MKPQAWVVVSRWPGSVSGSRKVACSRCGSGCVLSPETEKHVTPTHTMIFVCMECLRPGELATGKIMPFSTGQIAEFIAGLDPHRN